MDNVRMNPEFIDKLNDLRLAFGKPMKITSGYRHTSHPIERKKKDSGRSHNWAGGRHSSIKRRCFPFIVISIDQRFYRNRYTTKRFRKVYSLRYIKKFRGKTKTNSLVLLI